MYPARASDAGREAWSAVAVPLPWRGVRPTVSAYPPIESLAFLSDGTVAALLGPDGNVEWLCLPRFDAPSVFGAILDRRAGTFRLAPTDPAATATRSYLPGSLVLETRWQTADGVVVVARRAARRRRWGGGGRPAAPAALRVGRRWRSSSTASPSSTTGGRPPYGGARVMARRWPPHRPVAFGSAWQATCRSRSRVGTPCPGCG